VTLGAIFAGGQARRFGSDKAAIEIDGVALIDRVAAALRPQCDRLVVVGRDWPGLDRVEDAPQPGLGPLGALAGALVAARSSGLRQVLASGCDLPDVPRDLIAWLSPGPAVIAGQPLLGLWPTELAEPLLAHLAGGERSLRSWIAAAEVREVAFGPIANINTANDLAAYLSSRADRRSSR